VLPNPVQNRANVRFSLNRGGPVSCALYDPAGNRVAELAGGVRPAGEHSISWDATGLQPGVYLCKLAAGAESGTVRLVKVR